MLVLASLSEFNVFGIGYRYRLKIADAPHTFLYLFILYTLPCCAYCFKKISSVDHGKVNYPTTRIYYIHGGWFQNKYYLILILCIRIWCRFVQCEKLSSRLMPENRELLMFLKYVLPVENYAQCFKSAQDEKKIRIFF